MERQNVIAASIVLRLGTYLAIAVMTAAVAHAAGFSTNSLKGSYGCTGTVNSVSGGTSSALSELIQLNLDGAGAMSGSMRIFFTGEECSGSIAPGSTYSVAADGTGNLILMVTFSGPDPDADFPNCAVLNPFFAPEKVAILLQENGEHFVMVGADDFASNASDRGDLALGASNFTGSCVSQTKF